jgi:hypothetical protein
VRAFFTPALRTTVIDERDLIRAAGHSPKDVESKNIKKFYDAGTFTYHATHKMKRSFDVVVHGVLRNGKCYTNELIPPYSAEAKDQIMENDPAFQEDCTKASLLHVYAFQENAMRKLQSDLEEMPRNTMKLHFTSNFKRTRPFKRFVRRPNGTSAMAPTARSYKRLLLVQCSSACERSSSIQTLEPSAGHLPDLHSS